MLPTRKAASPEAGDRRRQRKGAKDKTAHQGARLKADRKAKTPKVQMNLPMETEMKNVEKYLAGVWTSSNPGMESWQVMIMAIVPEERPKGKGFGR